MNEYTCKVKTKKNYHLRPSGRFVCDLAEFLVNEDVQYKVSFKIKVTHHGDHKDSKINLRDNYKFDIDSLSVGGFAGLMIGKGSKLELTVMGELPEEKLTQIGEEIKKLLER